MSEQWHYEQKGGSYIKVDTLHKIRTLESELAAARKGIAKLKEQYTPWWARKRSEIDKLREVTEQRDRMADLVKQFIYILDITEESDGGRLFHPTNITSCRAGDLQKAGQLVEALRRAVKGGADELQG